MKGKKRYGDKNSPAIPASDMEQGDSNASLGEKKAKRCDSRINIHIHSIRKRLVDPDGVSAKAVIDGIVKAGLLPDDSSEFVNQVSYSQEKGKEEETIITLYAPPLNVTP